MQIISNFIAGNPIVSRKQLHEEVLLKLNYAVNTQDQGSGSLPLEATSMVIVPFWKCLCLFQNLAREPEKFHELNDGAITASSVQLLGGEPFGRVKYHHSPAQPILCTTEPTKIAALRTLFDDDMFPAGANIIQELIEDFDFEELIGEDTDEFFEEEELARFLNKENVEFLSKPFLKIDEVIDILASIGKFDIIDQYFSEIPLIKFTQTGDRHWTWHSNTSSLQLHPILSAVLSGNIERVNQAIEFIKKTGRCTRYIDIKKMACSCGKRLTPEMVQAVKYTARVLKHLS